MKFKDENGLEQWKNNLKNSEDDHEKAYFNYPTRKVYNLSKDKLQKVTRRLLNEKIYMNFLENKINKNKY